MKHIVQGLWIDGELSPLEWLTIRSFQKQGYIFHLYTYHLQIKVPENTIVLNANHIIPKNDVFQYKNTNQYGHGKGSYAGFSDIFRYKLLYENGGWWTDMDITCLKRLPEKEYVFRSNKSIQKAIGNVIFCPQKSELMRLCYEKSIVQIQEDNIDWNRPIEILNESIQELELQKFIIDISNPDSWPLVGNLMNQISVPKDFYCIHWMNEEWRRLNLSKTSFPESSVLYQLCKTHEIPVRRISTPLDKLKFRIRTSKMYYILINLKHLPAYLPQ